MLSKKHIKHHFYKIIYPERIITPWRRMIVCGSATFIPLLIGLIMNTRLSIFGALTGYVVALSYDAGTLKHRFIMVTSSLLAIVSAYTVGQLLKDSPVGYFVTMTVVIFALGIVSGTNSEWQKTLLFSSIYLLIGWFSPRIPSDSIPQVLLFVLIGYLSVVAGMLILHFFVQRSEEEDAIPLITDIHPITLLRVHATIYTICVLLALFIAVHYNIQRGYWIAMTVLLVMRPDFTVAFYKLAQRFIGTLGAVLVAELLVLTIRQPWMLVIAISVCAMAFPWAVKVNYWIVSFLATIMVVLFMEFTSATPADLHIPFVRLTATLIGCTIALIGTIFSRSVNLRVQRSGESLSDTPKML